MTVKTWQIALAFVLLLLVLAAFWTYRGHRMADALRVSEAAKLKAEGVIVATQESNAILHASVDKLLTENAELKAAYERVKQASPDSQATGAAQLSTGPIQVHGHHATHEGDAGARSEPLPAPGGHSVEGVSPAGPGMGSRPAGDAVLALDSTPIAKECVLGEGDLADIRVDLVKLDTQAGNGLLVGTAGLWRTRPAPETRILGGAFTAQLSGAEEVTKPSEPRWGAYVSGRLGLRGIAPGAGLLFPPVRVLGVRLEAVLGAETGLDPGLRGQLGVRF